MASSEGNTVDGQSRKYSNSNIRDPEHFQEIGVKMLGFATLENGEKRVKGKFHGIRAHANPLADMLVKYPTSPAEFDITPLFTPEAIERSGNITIVDVGCGYGGMTTRLGEIYPERLTLGLEIREVVVEIGQEDILKRRAASPGEYGNCAIIRTNAMKYFPCYFTKGQLDAMLFLFPDPHFKKSNHRRRIISYGLLAEYAFAIKKGGLVYTATDVKDLMDWMESQFELSPMFETVDIETLEGKEKAVVESIGTATADAERAKRKDGEHHIRVFRRV